MITAEGQFIVGIDLGTTNSALSYIVTGEALEGPERIRIFQIPQLVGPGEFTGRPVLPSFLYIPGRYDIPEGAGGVPWRTESDIFVGTFARDHGSKVPARLISSAKSWLCHAGADRRARILPWGADTGIQKLSPVEATAHYLRHLRRAWNHARGDEADHYLENQPVTITVPASFDEIARDLTLEAAEMAGLKAVTLLEEPLAAFYSWLAGHERDWSGIIHPGELILVCDVGGGTTDFTLITLREAEGTPRFERIAVGDHLILGGDNMDLALARQVEARMGRKGKSAAFGGDRWKNLTHQCRQAKEDLLSGQAEERQITIMGKGKKLISDTHRARLDRQTAMTLILDGFFPRVDPGQRPPHTERKGITEFGLPYDAEPAITRHLGWFLESHRQDVARTLGRGAPVPDHILFNGGALKAPVVQERIRRAIGHWFGLTDADLPGILANPQPDLAVAIGAAYYGMVKRGSGVRVGSGSPRSYYLGIATGSAEKQVICLVERGLDEGSQIALPQKRFDVLTNQPVELEVFSSSFRSGDRCGDLIALDETFSPLPPLRTVIQFGRKGARKAIPVHIEAEYTEVGTLALWCRSEVSDHRWRLQFQLRQQEGEAGVAEADVFDEAVTAEVCGRVRTAFRKGAEPADLDRLPRRIADTLDLPRERWPLSIIRKLADELLSCAGARQIRHLYEARWLNLLGFSMRPGFGEAFDPQRMKAIWKFYKTGPVHAKHPQVRAEWWIFWRRVAGGLTPGQQRHFIQDLSPLIFVRKGAKVRLSAQEFREVWMAAANMELLSVADKLKWGERLMGLLEPGKSPPQMLWSLSRFGARELLYGSVDRVLPPDRVGPWIDTLMDLPWPDPAPVCSALAQMGRKTGDRMRDIDPAHRERVARYLTAHGAAEAQQRIVTHVMPVVQEERQDQFGESLPAGIILKEA